MTSSVPSGMARTPHDASPAAMSAMRCSSWTRLSSNESFAAPAASLCPMNGRLAPAFLRLAPGAYGAWLELGGNPPGHAPLPFAVLPRSQITPTVPGVEIPGATLGAGGRPVAVREGANVTVGYCRPQGSDASAVWIGVFPDGTPSDQLTRDNADLIGYWLRAPGSPPTEPCGQATAFTSELTPWAAYEVLLMQDEAGGSSVPVGRHAQFEFLPTLPQATSPTGAPARPKRHGRRSRSTP